MSSLNGKVAVVTGGASGIGRAICRLFAAEGAKLVVGDVDVEKGGQVVREINDAGGCAIFVRADVSSYDDVKALVESAIKAFGKVDVMVNNAGVLLGPYLFHETPIQVLDKSLDVNVKGVFYGMKCVIPYMLRQGGGVIINMASGMGIVGAPGLSCYCASKGAVIQLTKVAAIEYAKRGIRVVAIAPGPTDTPLLKDLLRESPDLVKTRVPMGRLASPEEIARVALFLASENSSYITGSAVIVDGGETAT
ncbi:MAG: glucose 1-dehydrogenase [Nitrososphaerota archaeon]|nr:glucose 1-dehydrogenase [Candidatus Bathyarchaeota archaeon]MDW8023871.1 glucose 1-dehydrogenase [Nitrososphaerota archaeon]